MKPQHYRRRIGPATVVACLSAMILSGCAPSGPPDTPRLAVTDTYHGVDVTDEYRWLESWDDQEVRSWSDAQNRYARRVLDGLPSVSAIRKRVSEILTQAPVSYYAVSSRGGTLFAIKDQPPLEQYLLVTMPSADEPDAARVLVDPNQLDPEGGISIDWYVPSPDGKLVAVSLSSGGSESGDLHLYDVATGREIDEVIPRVNNGTAGGDVAWTPDGSAFYYTRYPRPGERADEELDFHQQIWFHRLGTSGEDDRYELGEELPRIAEFRLETDPSSGRILASYQYGDSGRFQYHLRRLDGSWVRLAGEEESIVQATFAPDGSLFMVSRRDAPRGKVLRLPPGAMSLASARVIVPEGTETIVSSFYTASPTVATSGRLFLTTQLGGPSTIRVYGHDGRPWTGPDLLPVSSVGRIVPLEGDEVLFVNESYLEPSTWFLFDGAGTTRKTSLSTESNVDFSDSEVVREFATSKDGTRIPLNIIRPKGMELDGTRPVLLTGYGGFGVSLAPRFFSINRLWVEQGGVIAVANLRGGGEFGEEWHRAGMLTNKQNVFDDFAAAMRHMVDAGYTKPERLAIKGGSNGGLLMGAMITQHPEACRAVASAVGIYDMLRVELSPNGSFNIPEYGTVENEEQFRALHAYSPYHHVEDGGAYPAVLFTTGANDPRVDPMQSRKMTARLQAAGGSGRPILLRTSDVTGHGGGTPLSERIEELTHVYAFLFHELSVTYLTPV